MKRLGFALVFSGLLAGAAFAAGAGKATFTAAADVKWLDVPDKPGVQIAPVEGNPTKGASHFFLKLKAGFEAPLHHHSADHFVTVLSGTMVLGSDGAEQKLGAGSFFSFTGKAPHTTKCDAGADCVLFIDARGKWDVVDEKVADKKPEPKK